ncbi:hypothetical protein MP638_003074 [Amoeboaphelidium occidentale]|nr:hypothetical protein MP638_003074 [Amoeboaphelidium occidentale]
MTNNYFNFISKARIFTKASMIILGVLMVVDILWISFQVGYARGLIIGQEDRDINVIMNLTDYKRFNISFGNGADDTAQRSDNSSDYQHQDVYVESLKTVIKVPVGDSSRNDAFYNNKEHELLKQRFWDHQDLLAMHVFDRNLGASKLEPNYNFIPTTRDMMLRSIRFLDSVKDDPIKRSQYAYACYFSFRKGYEMYLDGLLSLVYAWKRHRSMFPFIVVSLTPMPYDIEVLFTRLHVTVIVVKVEGFIFKDRNEQVDPYSVSFNKLILWHLPHFKKLVVLDADILMLDNVDELFGLPELSASFNVDECFLHGMNAGVMVIEPNKETFDKLATYFLKGKSCISGSFKWAEQELLSCVYAGKKQDAIGSWYQLPYPYGGRPLICKCKYPTNDTSLLDLNYWRLLSSDAQEFKLVHFYGEEKPWKVSQKEAIYRMSSDCIYKLYMEFFSLRSAVLEHLGFYSVNHFHRSIGLEVEYD